MTESRSGQRVVRRRIRNSRQARFMVLCLGMTAVALGLALCVGHLYNPRAKLLLFGLGYLVGGSVLFGMRAYLIRKHKERRARMSKPSTRSSTSTAHR
jgi:uncharacterized membrane protein YfcA